jgi:radical SAM protein with 4Fe4S-binding SPASM domain
MRVVEYGKYLVRYWRRHSFVFGHGATLRKLQNFMLCEWEARQQKIDVRSYPWELFIDPVNICPLRCPLCNTGRGLVPRTKMMMSFQSFKKYVGPLVPYLYKIKLFNYGEPFLNPELFDMITFARSANIAVQVNSNLNVWNESFAEACVRSGLDTLVVSFDGVTQDVYQSYRIGGDVDKVKRAVESVAAARRKLNSKTPHLVLQFLMHPRNVHEYEAVAVYAAKIGALFFPQPITFDIQDDTQRSRWLPPDEAASHYDRVKLIKKKDRPEKGCGFLWNNPVINVDGGISPCCHVFYKSTDFGNLEEDSFIGIWRNEQFRAARKMQHDKKKSDAPIVCSRCLDFRAFSNADYDLVNEYRTNDIEL